VVDDALPPAPPPPKGKSDALLRQQQERAAKKAADATARAASTPPSLWAWGVPPRLDSAPAAQAAAQAAAQTAPAPAPALAQAPEREWAGAARALQSVCAPQGCAAAGAYEPMGILDVWRARRQSGTEAV
jgi:hypothetical protein